jgi:hypothetical protein
MPFLLRMATRWEKSGDPRRAAACLKRAAEECPRSLQAVGELARFYERTRETLPRNVLLDGSLALLREDLRNDPANLETLRTAIPLLRWRQRPACSQAVAQVLMLLTDDPAERAELAAWAAPREQGRRLTPLANPELDELSLPSTLPPGVREVMRLGGPALQKSAKPNLKRWEVGRAERLGAGAGARAVGDAVAIDLGVRGFEVYVSTARPRSLVVEPGDPPALIVGREIAALPAPALRFAFGYALRLAATHFDLLAQGSPVETGVLIAGFVRQASPDFRHPDLPEGEVAAAAARVTKALPKSLRSELAPFAAEVAAPFDVQRLHVAVQEMAARVGLLASGDVAAALQVLALMHDRSPSVDLLGAVPLAAALVDFVLSEEHEKLVAALDAVS